MTGYKRSVKITYYITSYVQKLLLSSSFRSRKIVSIHIKFTIYTYVLADTIAKTCLPIHKNCFYFGGISPIFHIFHFVPLSIRSKFHKYLRYFKNLKSNFCAQFCPNPSAVKFSCPNSQCCGWSCESACFPQKSVTFSNLPWNCECEFLY